MDINMILVVVCGGVIAFVLWSTQSKIKEIKEDITDLRWKKVSASAFDSFAEDVDKKIELLEKELTGIRDETIVGISRNIMELSGNIKSIRDEAIVEMCKDMMELETKLRGLDNFQEDLVAKMNKLTKKKHERKNK